MTGRIMVTAIAGRGELYKHAQRDACSRLITRKYSIKRPVPLSCMWQLLEMGAKHAALTFIKWCQHCPKSVVFLGLIQDDPSTENNRDPEILHQETPSR